jgi:hypothetical protein
MASGDVGTGSEMGAPAASTHAMHAAISPASDLVAERRALYRLAAELFAPGFELSDSLADHPIVRYEIGRVLAGNDGLDPLRLQAIAEMRVRDVGVALASDPQAADVLEAPLRIIAQSGVRPQPITEADGERFEAVAAIVAEGVNLFRRLDPVMADDLLAHVSMLAVFKRETSGGVVSASSRYVPGIVLIDEPATPIEVAEALVHEGAHEKFFDLAITREFLDSRAEDADWFVTSWSGARWPLEQTFAAWHAYSCLAQFFISAGAEDLGPISLLPKARERADEIGHWLLAHENDLRVDARWLLHGLVGSPTGEEGGQSDYDRPALRVELNEDDCFHVWPDVRFRSAGTGRMVGARAAQPPEIYWLDTDASWLVVQLQQHDRAPISFEFMLSMAVESWCVDFAEADRRVRRALSFLVCSSLLVMTKPSS